MLIVGTLKKLLVPSIFDMNIHNNSNINTKSNTNAGIRNITFSRRTVSICVSYLIVPLMMPKLISV